MKKLNKKGFTLIEMLVVIAIIAILVAIIIPTVSSATNKAAAATNAANLRSILAEATTDMLAGTDEGGYVSWNGTVFTVNDSAPKSKKVGTYCDAGKVAVVTVDANKVITVTYDGHNIDYFAGIAENGKLSST